MIERFVRIVKLQVVAVGVALVMALGFNTAASAEVRSDRAAIEAVAEQTAERNHFYRVIAGEESGRSTRASDALAVDIRVAINNADGVGEIEQALDSFDARGVKYDGITDDIGFNPFDNAGRSCDECGVLTAAMQSDVLTILDGNVESLVEAVPEVPAAPGLLTGADIRNYLLAWQLGGGLAFFVGLKLYGGRRLTWRRDNVADGLSLMSFLLAPVAVGIYQPINNRKLRQLEDRDHAILDSMGLLNELHNVERELAKLRALPENRRLHSVEAIRQLADVREEIMAIPANMSTAQANDVVSGELGQVEAVVANARDRMAAVNAALKDVGLAPVPKLDDYRKTS